MTDLDHRLAALGSTPAPRPSARTVFHDVALCRDATRRRRNRRSATAVTAAAVTGALAWASFSLTAPGISSQPAAQTPVTSPASAAPSVRTAPVAHTIKLVKYAGPQTGWFRMSVIPEGFTLVGSKDSDAVIVPGNGSGASVTSEGITAPENLVLELSNLQGYVPTHGTPDNWPIGTSQKRLDGVIHGRPAWISYTAKSQDQDLLTWQVDGFWLQLSVSAESPFTPDQLVQIAAGITITGTPPITHG